MPGLARALLPRLAVEEAAEAVAQTIATERELFMRPRMLGVMLALIRTMPGVVRWATVRTGWSRPK